MTENNFDKLSMKIKLATKVVAESGKKDSDAELRKAVMLLMYQCLSVNMAITWILITECCCCSNIHRLMK